MASNGSPRKTSSIREIPNQRVVVNDSSQLPHDYSTTPGGTIFSTTPGGTRIIYDRAFLMQMRNSPATRTPPKNLPSIPGVTSPSKPKDKKPNENGAANGPRDKPENSDEPLFTMDV